MTYKEHIKNIRRNIIKMHYKSKKPHLGSSLSCVEILFDVYFKRWEKGDKVILSKSHAATALYATIAEKGLISIELLDTYSEEVSLLIGHCGYHPQYSLDYCGGALGMGLSYGIGQALSYPDNHVYVILGDGECDEGNIFEAFNYLRKRKFIKNLSIIIDKNYFQGYSMYQGNILLDGIIDNFSYASIEQTIKGKGISFLENTLESHYKILTEEEYNKAMDELR